MFDKVKSGLKKRRAKQKVAAYEAQYRKVDSPVQRPLPLPVEPMFDAFVEEFGGEKISNLILSKSQMPLNADYVFRDHNVVVELKTLEGVYSGPNAGKSLLQAFIDAGRSPSEFMGFLLRGDDVPERVGKLVNKRIRRALEQRIKHARKQLRQSKAQFGNTNTRSLILIAMDQEPLFGHRAMLLNLAKIMSDNYADEHTDGVVYLNPNMPTKVKADGMEFSGWYPFYRDEKTNEGLSEFVNLLGNRWLNYFGAKVGPRNPILELDSIDGMLHVLGSD